MTDPQASGERFIASSGPPLSMLDIARLLRERLGEDARRVPTRRLPDWVVRAAGRFDAEVHDLVPLLGQRRSASGAKAARLLGWSARPWADTVTASAESLLRPADRASPLAERPVTSRGVAQPVQQLGAQRVGLDDLVEDEVGGQPLEVDVLLVLAALLGDERVPRSRPGVARPRRSCWRRRR